MSEAFIRIVNMSITASWLVLAVIAVRFLFKKTPKWILCLLWAFVAVRLICPVSIESSLSLIPNTQPLGQEIIFAAETEKPANGEILDAEGTILYEQSAPAANGEILDAEGNVIYKQNLERYHDRTQKQMLLNVLSGIWFAGVGLMFLYTLASYWLLRRKVSTAIAIRKGIYQCDSVDSPFVLGLIHPVIYLPFGMADQDMGYVIAHEQAHIRRKDHWWKPLGFLLLTVYWFNPLMWVAYVLLCRDIELACDEKVIEKLGNEQRADYTQALVACSIKRRSIAACPLAFGEVGVKERVKSIMNYRKPAFWVVLLAILACVAVAVCFLTDPIDSAEEPIEIDGMQMQQVSFLYDTEQGYYLLIGADGVNEIQVSLPDSGGGVVNADGSSFQKGEKVYLESLQGITDLRGLSITALGENGEVLYGLSIPEDASMEDVINTVGSDGWLLAPTEHIVGPTIDSPTESTHHNPPSLTITYREETIEEPRIGLVNWEYTKKDGTKETVMGDGAHPLDAKHSSPFLTLDPYVDEPFEIWLHWDLMPDSVLVRYWDESFWGKLETEPAGRILVKEKNKAGNAFCFEPKEENCIYEVLATWDNDPNYSGKVYYNFYAVITDRELTVQELYKEYASTGDKGSHIYVDLDEDGVEELFIYRSGRTSEIATISEGKVVTVMASSHLFLCDGGIIGRYSEGGGGRTMFYYRIENQAAVIADVIVNTFQDDAWYRSTDPNLEYASPENMTRITKEEAYEVSKQYAIAEENIPSRPDCTTWLYGEE